MADVRIALRELLRKYRDDHHLDALKEGLVLLVQELMEAEVKEKTGEDWYERIEGRRTYCNGYQPRQWDTRLGGSRSTTSATGATSRASLSPGRGER